MMGKKLLMAGARIDKKKLADESIPVKSLYTLEP
jgi:hypothetical protein